MRAGPVTLSPCVRAAAAARRLCGGSLLALALGLAPLPLTAAPVFKCTMDGAVTYQRMPCPTGETRGADPTVEQLNAERQRKLREAAARRAAAPATPAPDGATRGAGAAAAAPVPLSRPRTPDDAPPPATAGFRCDGRTHCSQMTSCAEAKYFHSRCPGTKMDNQGQGNGIPCERQWCKPDADERSDGGRSRRRP